MAANFATAYGWHIAANVQFTHEVLGWWYIPVALGMGVVLIMVTTLIVRGCLWISSQADSLGHASQQEWLQLRIRLRRADGPTLTTWFRSSGDTMVDLFASDRRSFVRALVGLSVAAAASRADAATVDAEPQNSPVALLKKRFAGKATQVLVLGTPHLSGAPKGFTSAMLEPLLSRLQVFAPDVICIESLSGTSVACLQTDPDKYAETLEEFGGMVVQFEGLGKTGAGLGPAAAEHAALHLLERTARSAAETRHLVACMACSGDPWSALLQWQRLPEAQRTTTDGVTAELAQALNRLHASRNENQLIGVALASRLNHDKVWPIDDHSADDVLEPIAKDLGDYLKKPGIVNTSKLAELGEVDQQLTSAEAVLATYRKMNSQEYGRLDVEVEWSLFVDQPMPKNMGRTRVVEWEVRNLRQVANIRRASLYAPGGRVLVIVGADHKPWFDTYLDLMCDLTVVDAEAVLR